MNDLEHELEFELHRVLDPLRARPIPARREVRPAGYVERLVGGAGAALALKVATGIAVAAAAVTVAGASTTGSVNPTTWGQQVQTQVQTCKADLQSGEHGIGACVSDFASQHGRATSNGARNHGNGSGTETSSHGNGNGADASNDKGQGQGQGKDNGKDHTKPPNNK